VSSLIAQDLTDWNDVRDLETAPLGAAD